MNPHRSWWYFYDELLDPERNKIIQDIQSKKK